MPLTPLPDADGVALTFRVIDAEYSDALDRIVLVAAEPNRLVILSAEDGSFREVALPLIPSSVSVAPDGKSAAVGHNAYLSIVALEPLTVQHTYPVSADVGDVVLAGNGYAYAFPRASGWEALYSIEVASGREAMLGTIYAGTVARLHPMGDRMYGADRGISPADIERYDISQGPAGLAYDSPYHGDHPMCGDLWFSDDGARIFTACGNAFRASNVREDDMKYNGALEGNPSVRFLDHSAAAHLVAVAYGSPFAYPVTQPANARGVSVFEDRYLTLRQRVALPPFKVAGREYAAEARFVFFNAQSTHLYVLAEAEAAAPIVQNFALVRFAVAGIGAPPTAPADPVSTPSAGVSLGVHAVDAEYSRALDRVLVVSGQRLLIVNPESAQQDSVALPLAATAVSVHPEGKQAAVAHDGWISLVDLQTRAVTETLAVSSPLSDVVLGANGFVYGFPSRDQWCSIHAVEIASGVETLGGVYDNTVARLHPARDRLYGANRGLSPSDLERYDIAGGPVSGSYDSPYHGDYAMCGNLWFSEDGARIFTACGNVFRASNVRADDMKYNGALEGMASVQHLDHSPAAKRIAAAIAPGYDTPSAGVALFEDQFLGRVRSFTTPTVTVSGKSYPTTAKFVFFNAAGTRLYTLAEGVDATVSYDPKPVGHTVLIGSAP